MRTELLKSCILCGSASIGSIDSKAKIYRCDGCGHIFNNPRPTSEEIYDHYAFSSTYDDWLKEREQRNRMWRKKWGSGTKCRFNTRRS